MLDFRVSNQTLSRLLSPSIVSDTINYITAKFEFTSDWDGLSKWVHFSQGDTSYIVELHDDQIEATQGLNLGEGIWEVYLHGNAFDGNTVTQRITTSITEISVKPTGILDGEPLPDITASEGEQILAKAVNAETIAQSVRNDADAGVFKGETGADGKTAYQSATDGGYTGTEEEFNTAIADIENKADKTELFDETHTSLTGKNAETDYQHVTTTQISDWQSTTDDFDNSKTDYKGVTHDTLEERLIQDNTDLRDDLNPNRMNISYSGTTIDALDSLSGYTEDLTIEGRTLTNLLSAGTATVTAETEYTFIPEEVDGVTYTVADDMGTLETGVSATTTVTTNASATTITVTASDSGSYDNMLIESNVTDLTLSYFTGTQNVEVSEVKSVGKNLYPYDIDYLRINNDGAISDNYYSISLELIPNTQYILQITVDEAEDYGFIYLSSATDDYDRLTSTGKKSATAISDDSGIIKIGLHKALWGLGIYPNNSIDKLSDLQLEQGTTATDYEPYQEDVITIDPPQELATGETYTTQVQTFDGATHIYNDSSIPANMTAKVPTDVPALLSRKETEIDALTTLTTEQQASVARLQAINDELVQQQADTQEAVDNIIPLIL